MAVPKPFVLLGPGDAIRAELEFRNWTAGDLAAAMDVDVSLVERLLAHETPVTPAVARALSRVFKQSPQFWLNAEARYRRGLQASTTPETASLAGTP